MEIHFEDRDDLPPYEVTVRFGAPLHCRTESIRVQRGKGATIKAVKGDCSWLGELLQMLLGESGVISVTFQRYLMKVVFDTEKTTYQEVEQSILRALADVGIVQVA